jgi:hypothetical protein
MADTILPQPAGADVSRELIESQRNCQLCLHTNTFVRNAEMSLKRCSP